MKIEIKFTTINDWWWMVINSFRLDFSGTIKKKSF